MLFRSDKAVEVKRWFDEHGFRRWSIAGIGPLHAEEPHETTASESACVYGFQADPVDVMRGGAVVYGSLIARDPNDVTRELWTVTTYWRRAIRSPGEPSEIPCGSDSRPATAPTTDTISASSSDGASVGTAGLEAGTAHRPRMEPDARPYAVGSTNRNPWPPGAPLSHSYETGYRHGQEDLRAEKALLVHEALSGEEP